MIAISATIPAQVTSEGLQNLLSHAIELENSKDYAGAERVYREVLLASADDPEILKRLGLVCQQQGKYEESIEIFQRILRRAPVYPEVNSLLAMPRSSGVIRCAAAHSAAFATFISWNSAR